MAKPRVVAKASKPRPKKSVRRMSLDERVEAELREAVREGALRLKRLGLVLPTGRTSAKAK
ncbi:MAG: hypothetical protein JWN73_3617 [Betaproteobacteria bacterium]|nr:hypothetical protein [Betaproteobacteria bacterium]